jgi:Mor family transcriptional regulator
MDCPKCDELTYTLYDHGIKRVVDGKQVPLEIKYAYCQKHVEEILRRSYENQTGVRQ